MVSESIEDYLEAIYILMDKERYIKTKEIASYLEISDPSVSEMIQKLKEKSFIDYKKYRGVKLTEKGTYIAEDVIESHQTIKKFLLMLEISDENADKDACRVEHYLSNETIGQLKRFVKFIEKNPDAGINEFREIDKSNSEV